MKSLTIISALLLLMYHTVEGQKYFPFPTEEAYWNVYLLTTCDNDSPPDTVLLQYTLKGDTTMNNTLYHKLCLVKGDAGKPIYETVGGLREEEKRIYFVGKGFLGSDTGEEFLLYDFTKQKGDTIEHDSNGSFSSIILEIDSIQIGDQYRKRYKVDNGWFYHNPDHIIEGIGSIKNGLLGHISDIPTCGSHYWEYVCFREKEQILYLNPTFPDCNAGILTNSIVDKNKTWYNHIHYYMSMSVNTEVIGFGADTAISDTTYAKVLRATGGVEIPFLPYGFLREKEGRIFYKLDTDSPERLIYDFTITEGDTVIVYGLVEWSDNGFVEIEFRCDSIRSREFNSISRRVYHLSPTLQPDANTESWIEGIGSLSGILHNYDGRVGGDTYILSCVYHNDNMLFNKYESGDCIRLALRINDITSNSLKVYPNPFNNELHIDNVPVGQNLNMRINNSLGQLIVDTELHEGNNLISYPGSSGLYIAIIKNDNGIILWKEKIIKR